MSVWTLISVLALPLAPAADGEQLVLSSESTLSFDGTSTVRNWTCRATAMQATVEAPGPGAARAVLGGAKAVRAATLSVPTAKLECGNGVMNEHMGKALHSDRFTSITFTLVDYDLTPGTPVHGTLRGNLTLNGVTRPIAMPAEFTGGENELHVTGSYALRMTDWSVVPPTLMLGTLKVGDTVRVKFTLELH